MDPHPTVLAIAMIAASGVYFFLDRVESNLWTRIFVSAHGIFAALLYFVAILIWEALGAYRPWAAWPFAFLYLIPVASVAFALLRFRGPQWLHVILVPIALCIYYTYIVGAMAVTGDWL